MSDQNQPVSPAFTFEDLIAKAMNGLNLLTDEVSASMLFSVVDDAANDTQKPMWKAWDVRNRVMIAILFELPLRIHNQSELCRAQWPAEIFEKVFVTPKKDRDHGWLAHITAQVSSQVEEYSGEEVFAIAEDRDEAIHLTVAERQNLVRAIDNGLTILEALEPEQGRVMELKETLRTLQAEIAEKAEGCKSQWPTDRFTEVFVTPREPGKDGWLAFVQSQVERTLRNRQAKLEWVERSIQNAEKILTVLRPDAPYQCRKCHTKLDNGTHRYCDECHDDWELSKAEAETRTGGQHRVKKPGSAARRHKGAKKDNNLQNEQTVDRSSKPGAKKAGKGKK